MEEFVEEINNQITTNFSVTKIPVGTLKEFKEYCKNNSGDSYSIGIQQLLKTNSLFLNLIYILGTTSHDILLMQKQIEEIKLKLINYKPEEKKAIKTFDE
jgi:hypothetical protein